MAETKPTTTADDASKKPDEAADLLNKGDKDKGAADQRQEQSGSGDKPAAAAAKPAATRAEPQPVVGRKPVEGRATASDQPVSPDTPSPTQAELDEMREGRFGGAKRRDVRPEGSSSEYKTR